ncbi:MAG: hypothetical protein M1836_006292 [Candelina mexicana]|nr:MAG: hypothetical protein M1836_006292 [Candelina mexicana]
MAEQSIHDVVNQAQSGGDASSSDVTATQISNPSTVGPAESQDLSFTNNNQRQDPSIPQTYSVKPEKSQPNGLERYSGPLEDTPNYDGGHFKPVQDAEKSLREVDEVYTNGEFEGQSGSEEGAIQHVHGDASGGSDTDTSKADNLESSDRGLSRDQAYVRSDSFKKPASFKAVSVTKNFLAKTAGGTTPISKGVASSTLPGLSGTSSQPVPRPRLVAKSGSGLRDAAPRPTSVSTGTARGTGPDPNQVWNKNRPVQPPPPKQFTDEELKQQYGIHLATRLQADETGKEAKWADIDDDEDDWAPDTIEWNDGTKITLPNPDILAEEQAAAAALQAKRAEAERIKISTPQHHSSVGPKATILKVGAPPSGQSKSGGLVLKGAVEKPTLVARPTPTTPVKSPWAPLPPVEKVPPVPMNPPQSQQPTPRFSQRDPHGFEAMPPPPSPAKEIAADDFNRSWRDGHIGNRELYNSQSGRYEPVSEGRRSSVRNDQGFRQPSVLQRPPQHDHQGPAEPSAAFQTSRSGGIPDGGRRRTSSNVSGGSGAIGRRVSFSKGQDMPPTPQDPHMQQRRGSQSAGPLQSVPSPRNISPSKQEYQSAQMPLHGHPPAQSNHRQSWHQRASPILNHTHPTSPHISGIPTASPTQPQQGPNQEANASTTQPTETQNPVLMQQQLMRERRELAIKRRKEQEEKDEAEKKERIRLKLEALGMTGPNEAKEKVESSAVVDNEPKKADETTAVPSPKSIESKTQGAKEPPKTKTDRAKLLTKITPSAHHVTGQPGTPSSNNAIPPPPKAAEPRLSQVTEPPPVDTAHQASLKDEAMSVTPGTDATSISREKPEEQPLKQVATSQDNFATWSKGGMTTHSTTGANMWGPPNNDKALGNGTFSRGFTRLAPRQPSQQRQLPPVPGPIGPPTPPQRNSQPQTSPHGGDTSLPQAQNENGSTSAQQKVSGTTPPAQVGQNEFGKANQHTGGQKYTSGPGPIAPPNGPANRAQQQRAQGVSAWKSFPAQVAREDAVEKQRAAELQTARLEEEARTGIRREAQQPTFKETWRQVAIDESVGQRQVVNVLKTSTGGHATETKPPMITGRQIQPSPVPAAPFSNSVPGNPSFSVRPSRFFPQSGRSISYTPGYVPSASPPPPDSVTHPAYDGDINRPLVSLPVLKPKPIVKLPPIPVAAIGLTEGTRAVSQPLVTPPSWQDKFNGLFGRKLSSPPKTSALAVNSSTKAPLDVPSVEIPATVSLPRSEDGESTPRHIAPVSDDTFDVTSKATEETLLEEREFGSLPTVKLPLQAPPKAWQPVRSPYNPRSKSKFQKIVEAESIQPLVFDKKENHGPHGSHIQLSIRLPGSPQTRYKYMRVASEPRHRTPSSNFKKKGPKARDSPNSPSSVQSPRGTQRVNQTGSLGPPSRQSVHPSPSFNTNPWGRVAPVGP